MDEKTAARVTIPSNGTGGNAKAFGGILLIVAVIAGLYAMIEPLTQRLDFLDGQINSIHSKMGLDDIRERTDQGQFSAINQHLKEIDARIKGLQDSSRACDIEQNKIIDKYIEHISDGHPQRVEQRIFAHAERLDKIDEKIEKVLTNRVSKHDDVQTAMIEILKERIDTIEKKLSSLLVRIFEEGVVPKEQK